MGIELPPDLLAVLRNPDIEIEGQREVDEAIKRWMLRPEPCMVLDQFVWFDAKSDTPGKST